jgi:6-pyruvoyltetrahydropterin/6-carboxytetrahydropterin synthase
MYTATRLHDISCGHRVVGHEGKCRFLHGHNYRIYFTCQGQEGSTDLLGRVIDFSVIKSLLCMWVENHWDHKLLLWSEDPLLPALKELDPESIVVVPFNPTAENMAAYLVEVVGPTQLEYKGVQLIEVTIEETRKCSATYEVIK